jgi:SAM-dependent methyltransferase
MHPTAVHHGKRFLDTYLGADPMRVLEVGAADWADSFRPHIPDHHIYEGCDFVNGENVTIKLDPDDPYTYPLEDDSIDAIISTSVFEHIEFPWLSFTEMMRVLKPSGLLYINAPTNGIFHRTPRDYWRYYTDSAFALANWGRRQGYACTALEVYIGGQSGGVWNDFVAVFLKDETEIGRHPNRTLNDPAFKTWRNGFLYPNFGPEDEMRATYMPQDMYIRQLIAAVLGDASMVPATFMPDEDAVTRQMTFARRLASGELGLWPPMENPWESAARAKRQEV